MFLREPSYWRKCDYSEYLSAHKTPRLSHSNALYTLHLAVPHFVLEKQGRKEEEEKQKKLKEEKRGINTEMKKMKYRLHSNSSNLFHMI